MPFEGRSFEEGYTKFEVAVYKTVGERFIPTKSAEEEFFDPVDSLSAGR